MKMKIFILIILSSLSYNGSINISCKYDMYSFWAIGNRYACYCINNFSIDSPDKVKIEEATGTHTIGRTNNDEIYFQATSVIINYFPQGLEKIFPNLVGIYLRDTKLKGIEQSDLKSYPKLTFLCLYGHDIQFLENDLFLFNPNLQHVLFQNCKIIHIGLDVFDNLNLLMSLFLGGNTCTDDRSRNNHRSDVQKLVNELKSKCQDSEFLKLDRKVKNLVEESEILKSENLPDFLQNLQNFEAELNISKFHDFPPQNNKFKKLKLANLNSTTSMKSLTTTIKAQNSQSFDSESEQCTNLIYQTHKQVEIFHAQNVDNFQNLSKSVFEFNGLVSTSFTKLDEKCLEIVSKFTDLNDITLSYKETKEKLAKNQVDEFTAVNQKLTDFDTKIDNKYSNLNQKLTSFENKMNKNSLTLDEKFTKLTEKLEICEENSGQNYAQLLQKVEKSLQVVRHNILKTVESKIDKLEKRLEGKFEEILNQLRGGN